MERPKIFILLNPASIGGFKNLNNFSSRRKQPLTRNEILLLKAIAYSRIRPRVTSAVMKWLVFTLSVALLSSLVTEAQAAPSSIPAVQKEIDNLRIVAAAKYEMSNETKIKIAQLVREGNKLKVGESAIRKQAESSKKYLAKTALDAYKQDGLGEGIALLFSNDPTRYLADASTLEILNRRYATEVRKFAYSQQKLAASQLVIRDKTKQLKLQQVRFNADVLSAQKALKKAEAILKSLNSADRILLVKRQVESQQKTLNTSKKYAKSFVGDNTRGSIAVKYAIEQIGDVYLWGGAGPEKWDCSGLTLRAFKAAGVSLPHSAAVQFGYGKLVSYKALKPGDLLFYGRPISHVSIYLGGGKMVQAPRSGKKVEVVPFTLQFGYKPFVGAKRL
ncbi:MAG: C40 family peptidase [Actinobacteria bacterium]|nr:C40 family peptidase [Actinomycetota bacterium]